MSNIKRGISDLVALSVLILLSLVSTAIVYNSINIKQLSPELECNSLRINPPFEIISTCYDSYSKKTIAEIKRNFGEPINSINFITESSYSQKWTCGELCSSGCEIPNEGQTKKYSFSTEETSRLSLLIGECVVISSPVSYC